MTIKIRSIHYFKDNLNKLIKETGTNIHRLSQDVGLANETIKKFTISEKAQPKLEQLMKLADHFGMTIDELVDRRMIEEVFIKE